MEMSLASLSSSTHLFSHSDYYDAPTYLAPPLTTEQEWGREAEASCLRSQREAEYEPTSLERHLQGMTSEFQRTVSLSSPLPSPSSVYSVASNRIFWHPFCCAIALGHELSLPRASWTTIEPRIVGQLPVAIFLHKLPSQLRSFIQLLAVLHLRCKRR